MSIRRSLRSTCVALLLCHGSDSTLQIVLIILLMLLLLPAAAIFCRAPFYDPFD